MTSCVIGGILLSLLNMSIAAEALVETHCAACHSGEGSEGNFRTAHLGSNASKRNIDFWKLGLERIEAGEMPPAEENQLTSEERQQLISFFRKRIYEYFTRNENTLSNPPRRLNNREFKNSVRDVLGIEDAGTH
ncbi:MAG: c-type cytochrome, partial [Pirellulales bacterium]|nr:c-type cytochrome [Pirellulales bacterium]